MSLTGTFLVVTSAACPWPFRFLLTNATVYCPYRNCFLPRPLLSSKPPSSPPPRVEPVPGATDLKLSSAWRGSHSPSWRVFPQVLFCRLAEDPASRCRYHQNPSLLFFFARSSPRPPSNFGLLSSRRRLSLVIGNVPRTAASPPLS